MLSLHLNGPLSINVLRGPFSNILNDKTTIINDNWSLLAWFQVENASYFETSELFYV